jgi:hypothetical protein
MPHRLPLVLFLALLAGCYNDEGQQGPRPDEAVVAPVSQNHAAVPAPFHDRLLEIARSYESYGRLDATARWAPVFCAPPPPVPEPRFSSSMDSGTHGRKLYSLFVKNPEPDATVPIPYTQDGEPSPVGQVVVKESWVPEEVQDDGRPLQPIRRVLEAAKVGEYEWPLRVDSFLPYARKDGRLYHAKEKGPLFIMFKLDPQTPGTDEGWVYGTVTPDGKEVTSAGRVEACMRCHQKAPHDRLFGLPEK